MIRIDPGTMKTMPAGKFRRWVDSAIQMDLDEYFPELDDEGKGRVYAFAVGYYEMMDVDQ